MQVQRSAAWIWICVRVQRPLVPSASAARAAGLAVWLSALRSLAAVCLWIRHSKHAACENTVRRIHSACACLLAIRV